jgi:hypothetical protein
MQFVIPSLLGFLFEPVVSYVFCSDGISPTLIVSKAYNLHRFKHNISELTFLHEATTKV